MSFVRTSARAGLLAFAFVLGSAMQSSAAAPLASFTWFPAEPHTGEVVSLVSTSTDSTTPIVATEWELAGEAQGFQLGGPVATTVFSTPGAYVVRLRVSASDGSVGIASEPVEVAAPPLEQMLPVPVVRMAAAVASVGTEVRLLSVEAPAGAQVTVSCDGRGCPHESVSRSVSLASVGTLTIDFARFERLLRPGTRLEVHVSKPGDIGKYTRFLIRKARPPARVDECLDSDQRTPVPCPL